MASEYIVISEFDLKDLIQEVNTELKHGWEPIGGVAISSSDGETDRYFQTLVRCRTRR